jgi:histone acetyltransferase (RNA polymerase elongator complex component)
LNKSYNDVLPELYDYALIRELHVYGQHTAIGNKENNKTQHRGLGKKLIATAEEIAALNGFEKIAIIAGIGVREYYKKIGYVEQNTYMVKDIDLPMKYYILSFVLAMLIICIIFSLIL